MPPDRTGMEISLKPDHKTMKMSLKLSLGVVGRAGGFDSFSAVGPPRLGEDVGQEAHLCQQIQEESRTIVEQVANFIHPACAVMTPRAGFAGSRSAACSALRGRSSRPSSSSASTTTTTTNLSPNILLEMTVQDILHTTIICNVYIKH